MKKLLLIISLISMVGLFFITSCKKDEDKGNVVSFSVNTQTGETNVFILKNETSGASCLWEWFKGTDTVAMGTSTNDIDTIGFPFVGTYKVRITVLFADEQKSEEKVITVSANDFTLLTNPIWTLLTGGPNHEKAWVLDVKGKVITGPLSFLGTSWNFVSKANNDQTDAWMWDPDPSWTFADPSKDLRMWKPGTEGYGVMKFNLIGNANFIADKNKEADQTGSFNINFETMTISINGASILRSYKPYARVKVDPTCVDASATDTSCARKTVDGMAGISDWTNYKIYDINDTVLRLCVSRDQDVHGEGKCWLIYNFISKAYDDAHQGPIEMTVNDWPATPSAISTNVVAQSSKLVGVWKVKTNETYSSWYPGFYDFATSTNPYPAKYDGTTAQSLVKWDPYIPPTDGTATWALPSDSIKACSMEFASSGLTLVVKKTGGVVVGSGTFVTDGTKMTTAGIVPITAPGELSKIIEPHTCIIVSVPAAGAAAGAELKLAFYQDDNGVKKQWVVYTYVKQ